MITSTPRRRVPLVGSPLVETDEEPFRLYRRSDASPIELFLDLFFVANLSTFTTANDIKSMEGWSA